MTHGSRLWAILAFCCIVSAPLAASTLQFSHVPPTCRWAHRVSVFAKPEVVQVWKAMRHLGARADVASRLAPAIVKSARKFDVDPFLMVSIARQETNFRLGARGSKGEVGVFQIMPRVWCDELGMTEEELARPEENTYACAYILGKYLRRYRGYEAAVKAYNHRLYGAPYARTVLKRYEALTAML